MQCVSDVFKWLTPENMKRKKWLVLHNVMPDLLIQFVASRIQLHVVTTLQVI